MLFYGMYILCTLSFCDTDGISAACYTNTDIFFPVWSVQTIDTDNPLNASVIDLL